MENFFLSCRAASTEFAARWRVDFRHHDPCPGPYPRCSRVLYRRVAPAA